MSVIRLGIVGCRHYTDYESFSYIVDDYLNGLYKFYGGCNDISRCKSQPYVEPISSSRARLEEMNDISDRFLLKIISGGSKGIDTLAERYAIDNKISFEKYDAKWYGETGKGKYDENAGTNRNTLIVKECNHVLALPSKTSVGTYDTIRKAKNAKLHVTVIDLPE